MESYVHPSDGPIIHVVDTTFWTIWSHQHGEIPWRIHKTDPLQRRMIYTTGILESRIVGFYTIHYILYHMIYNTIVRYTILYHIKVQNWELPFFGSSQGSGKRPGRVVPKAMTISPLNLPYINPKGTLKPPVKNPTWTHTGLSNYLDVGF